MLDWYALEYVAKHLRNTVGDDESTKCYQCAIEPPLGKYSMV
jgi:hypothetical protein